MDTLWPQQQGMRLYGFGMFLVLLRPPRLNRKMSVVVSTACLASVDVPFYEESINLENSSGISSSWMQNGPRCTWQISTHIQHILVIIAQVCAQEFNLKLVGHRCQCEEPHHPALFSQDQVFILFFNILACLAGKDNLVTGGSNWPLIGFTYTSCFRLGSRTNRFQGDADLLQTCKMGMYYISLLILWMLVLRGTDHRQSEKIRILHFDCGGFISSLLG